MTDVRTMLHYPQSNWLDGRVHSTIHKEVHFDIDSTLYQVEQLVEEYHLFYNGHWPQS